MFRVGMDNVLTKCKLLKDFISYITIFWISQFQHVLPYISIVIRNRCDLRLLYSISILNIFKLLLKFKLLMNK